MVIEYAGTVIRAVLTDKREKYYDSKVSECNDFVQKRKRDTGREKSRIEFVFKFPI